MDTSNDDLNVGVSFDADTRPILSALAEIKATLKALDQALPKGQIERALVEPIAKAVKAIDGSVNGMRESFRKAQGAMVDEAQKGAKAIETAHTKAARALLLDTGEVRKATQQAQREVAGHYNSLGIFISDASAKLEAQTKLNNARALLLDTGEVRKATQQAKQELAGHYNSLGLFVSDASANLAAQTKANTARALMLDTGEVRKATQQAQRETTGHYNSLGVFISDSSARLEAQNKSNSARALMLDTGEVRKATQQAQREVAGHYNNLGVFISDAAVAAASRAEAANAMLATVLARSGSLTALPDSARSLQGSRTTSVGVWQAGLAKEAEGVRAEMSKFYAQVEADARRMDAAWKRIGSPDSISSSFRSLQGSIQKGTNDVLATLRQGADAISDAIGAEQRRQYAELERVGRLKDAIRNRINTGAVGVPTGAPQRLTLDQRQAQYDEAMAAMRAIYKEQEDLQRQAEERQLLSTRRVYEDRRNKEKELNALRDKSAAFDSLSPKAQLTRATRVNLAMARGMSEADAVLRYGEAAVRASRNLAAFGDENARLTSILKNTNKIMNDGHSAARGLASGFNAMWLTWGNIAPLLAGAAVSNAFVQSAKYGMEVAHTLDIIRNIGGATTAEMARLESAMLSMARNGPSGPLEIAEAMKTLSLAGVRANEVVSATQTVLNFSVAGTTDLKQAADTLVAVSTAFGMGAQGFGRVADVVSKAAAESMVSVESFSQSMKTASVINAQYGVSLEDTATGIAVLSKLGIEGSAAGTALRNMYVDLSGRTEQTARVLKKLGVELRDAQSGGFRPMVEIVTELTAKFNTLDALSQKNLMQALFSERGAKGIVEAMRLVMTSADDMGKGAQNALEEVRISIENSAGFSAIAAAKMAQSAENQLKQTQSSLRAAMFEAFREMEPMLLVTMDAMRKAFASPEFKSALEGVVTTVASLTRALTENLGVIVMAATVYGSAKVAQLALVGAAGAWQGVLLLTGRAVVDETGRIVARTAAVVADTAATQLNTAAKVGNAAAAGGALLGLAKAIPFVGTAVTLATTAWIGYEMWTSRATDADKAATDNYNNNVVKRLNDESERLEEINRLVREGLSLKEADARISQRGQEGASSRLDDYQKAMTEFEVAARARERLKGKVTSRAEAGAVDVANLQLANATAEVQRTYRWLSDEDKRMLEAGQRRAAAQKERDATLKREEEARNKAIRDAFGKNTFDLSDAKQRGVEQLKTDLGNELSLIEKRYADEVSTIQQEERNKQRLLAAEHQNKLISDGEFHSRELQLAQEAEAKRTALISTYGLERALKQKELEGKLLENYERTLGEIDSKLSGGEATKARQQALEAYQGAFKKLSDEAATFNQRLNNDGKSIEDNALTRMTLQAHKAAGAVRDVQLKLEDFQRSQKAGKEDADRAEALNDALRNATGGQAEYLRAAASEQEKFIAQYREYDKAIEEAEKSLNGYVAALGEEVDLSYEQSAALGQYIELLEKLKKARAEIQGGETEAVTEAGMRALRRYQKDEIKRLSGDTAEALITGLTKGSKQGGKSLRKIIEAELRKPIVMAVQALVQPVVGSIVGSITNSVAGSAGSSMLSSMGGSVIGSTVMGGLGGIGAGFMSGVSETMLGSAFVGPSATAAGGATGMAAQLGAAAPYLAAAAAIYMIADSLDDSGTYHTGGAAQYKGGALRTSLGFRDNEEGLPSYNPKDNIDNQFGLGFGYVERGDQTISAVSTLAQSLGTAFDGLATSFGKAAGYEVATAFADDSSKDGAWGALRISKDGQELLNWQNTRTSRWAPKEFGDGEGGYKEYLAAVAKDTRQVLLDMDLPGWAKNMLKGIGESASIDQLAQVIQQIGQVQAVFVQLGNTLEGFAGMTDTAKEKLLAASGGAQALAQNAATFYQNYYSEQERTTKDTAALAKEFENLGLALPSSKEELRQMVETQVKMGDAGAETAAKLMGLSGAFNAVSQSAQNLRSRLTGAFSELASSLAEMRGSVAESDERVRDARMAIWDSYSAAQQKVIDLEKEAADSTRKFAQSLRNYLSGMDAGSDSSLGVEARYQVLGQRFNNAAASAASGDEASREGLTGMADAYLAASRARSRTSVDYARDAARVRVTLENLASKVEADPLVKKYDEESLTLQQRIADAQADVVKHLALMSHAGVSTQYGVESVDSSLKALRDEYVKSVQEQANANLQLNAALGALSSLGLSESLVKLLAQGAGSSAEGQLAASLSISPDSLAAITEALQLTEADLEERAQTLQATLLALTEETVALLASDLYAALEFDPAKFDTLKGIISYDPESEDFLALQTILGYDGSSEAFNALRKILGYDTESDAFLALQKILGYDPESDQFKALQSVLGYDPESEDFVNLRSILGVSDEQLTLLPSIVGFAKVNNKPIEELLPTVAGFSLEARAAIQALPSLIGFSDLALAYKRSLETSVGLGFDPTVRLGSIVGLGFDPTGRLGSIVGLAFDPQGQLGSSVGLQAGVLSTLSGALGLSAEARGALAQMNQNKTATSQADQLVTKAYASLGRTGIGTAINQVDAAGYQYWVNALTSGRVTESNLIQNMYKSVAEMVPAGGAYVEYVASHFKKQGLTAENYFAKNPDVAKYWNDNVGDVQARFKDADMLAFYHYMMSGVGEKRSFAVGTNYVPYDMVAQIHEGERIIPAADNARLEAALNAGVQQPATNSGAEIVAELRAVRAELTETRRQNAEVKAELQAIKRNTSNTDKTLTQVTRAGTAMVTTPT